MSLPVVRTLQIMLRVARPHLWLFGVMVLLIAAGYVANILSPLYLKKFFDVFTVSTAADVPRLKDALLLAAGLALLGWFFVRFSMFLNTYFQPTVMAKLEMEAFRYTLGHSYRFFTDTFVGSLVKKIGRFQRSFETIFDVFQHSLLPTVISGVTAVVVLWQRHWIAGIMALGWIVLITVFNIGLAMYKIRYDIPRAELDSKIGGTMADIMSNHLTVQMFATRLQEIRLVGSLVERLRRMRMFSWKLGEMAFAIQTLSLIALEYGLFWFGLDWWARGELTLGDFVLVQGVLLVLATALWDMAREIRNLYEALADAKDMVEIFDTPYEVMDAPRTKALRVRRGEIVFDHVGFSYLKDREVLSNVTLTVTSAEKIALVGASGSGKSTVVKVLLRLFDVTRGAIRVDGLDLREVTQDSLHRAIAMVPQEPLLFHRSIRDNIRYARPGASEQEVVRAAKLAHCHEFILGLPNGYDSLVGERGIKLSGGERQRVAIARAVLKAAPILVMDEATSSLDSESEAYIQEALAMLMQKRTVIVIAHRLSTIMKMDRIVVMDKGRIVEAGTHQELLDQQGFYARLWARQVGGFLGE